MVLVRNVDLLCLCSDSWCCCSVLWRWYLKPCLYFRNKQGRRHPQEPLCSGVLHTILSDVFIEDSKSPKANGKLLCFKKRLPQVVMLKKHFMKTLKLEYL